MSTGDLMKVITMSAPEPEPVKAAAGDWVLDLQEDVCSGERRIIIPPGAFNQC